MIDPEKMRLFMQALKPDLPGLARQVFIENPQTAMRELPGKLQASRDLLNQYEPGKGIDPRLMDQFMNLTGFAPMGMTANVTKQAATSLLDQPIQNTTENQLQKAFATVNPGDTVSGLVVRKDVPNMGSIGASLDNYEVLEGIRNVPSKAFDKEYLDSLKAQGLDKRTSDLSEQIKKSKEINPLIVAVDSKGAYIIEGGHRFDALMTQGRVSVPAKVVIDKDDPPTKEFLERLFR